MARPLKSVSHSLKKILVSISVLAALVLPAACAKSPRIPAKPIIGPDNLRQVAALFVDYVKVHKGKPPADETEYERFILKHHPAVDVEALLRSPRDGQKYEIIWKPLRFDGSVGALPPLLAYERTSVGGKRYVVYPHEEVEEVDDEKFGRLLSAANARGGEPKDRDKVKEHEEDPPNKDSLRK